jgi:pimeloyl-ACP methyl ester carboxylesterase
MALLTLADGRTLEVRASGPEDGLALVIQHGTPGSLARFRVFEEQAERRGLRLVTYSRPGYGSSTRQPGRVVADVAADLEAVLDHLGAERCVTLGWSGGGPHALACAALLPSRVAAVASVAGVGPFGRDDLDFMAGMGEENVVEFGAAVAGAGDLTPALQGAAEALRDAEPADLIEAMSTLLPPADRAALDGQNGTDLAAMMTAGLQTGADGWIDDDLAFVAPWGFDPAAIRVPVSVWQGEEDLMVPFAHGRWLAEHIPGAAVHLQPGRGHLSIFFENIDEIFDELVAAAQS